MRYIIVLLLLGFLETQAQNSRYAVTYEVTRPDIENNTYAKDSTANALVLYERGDSFVDKNTYRLNTDIRRKLKILNRNGFDYAEVSVFLYNNDKGRKEKISNINASVYNIENGKVVQTKLKKADIFEEKYNDNYTLIKFAFPNIKEGSVVHYSYRIESPFMFKYKSWSFQSSIPTLYSEYNTSIPGNWEYNIKLVGGKKLAINENTVKKNCLSAGAASANCSDSKYVMVDVPAFIEEDYMTTKANYLARIEYELKTLRGFDGTVDHITKSWEAVDNEIERETSLGQILSKLNRVKDLIPKDDISNQTPLNKAETIYYYVLNNYKWNKEFDLFENVSIKNLLKDKSGSAGEINALLYILLKTNDIDVKPIILSTRNNGLATQIYPVLSDFNYLIVKATIDGQDYLLDATENHLSFGQIPFRCLNQYGRLLDFENGSSWYDIASTKNSLAEYGYELNFDANQVLTGKVNYKTTEYHSFSDRKNYFSNKDTYIEAFKNKYNSLDISNFNVIDTEKTSTDFKATFTIESSSDIVGNTVYLNPFLFKFFSENPFKLQERSYPIDFGYKDTYIYKIKINIDDSYNILEIPENVNLALPGREASVRFTAQQKNNEVLIYFKLSFSRAIYPPDFYSALKEIMNKVIDTQNNALIVLEQKQ